MLSFLQSKGWKTVTGCLLALLGYLSGPDVLAMLPPKFSHIVTAIGAALATLGIYHRVVSVDNAVSNSKSS